jgi:hypothetical protein
VEDHHARNGADDRLDQRGRVAFRFDDGADKQRDVLRAVTIEQPCQPGPGVIIDGGRLEGHEQPIDTGGCIACARGRTVKFFSRESQEVDERAPLFDIPGSHNFFPHPRPAPN